MEFKTRKSVNDKLRVYDYLAKEDDYIEVTEWVNGEGIDISINTTSISLSYGQLDAINYLQNALRYKK